MVCEKNSRVFLIADQIFKDMVKASAQLKLRVEEPHWIELSKETNREELDEQLRNYMLAGDKIRHPTMVVCLL